MDPRQRLLCTPNEVLTFWFGLEVQDERTLSSLSYIDSRMSIWFAGASAAFDNVQKANAGLIELLGSDGPLEDCWATREGLLARVIVLDQFPRCIYRGTKNAFKFDRVVALLVKSAVENGWLPLYSPIQRFFLGVAAQHSESISMQEVGVEIAHNVGNGAAEDVKLFFKNLKGYPMEHYDVIRQFGRFPSRNPALGRESTAEELEWLASPDCPSWARSQLRQAAVSAESSTISGSDPTEAGEGVGGTISNARS